MREIETVDEAYLTLEGYFDAERFPDCDVFSISSEAAIAGYANQWIFEAMALNDPRFHHHKVRVPGKKPIIATHSDSAAWYGEQVRLDKVATSRANLRRGPRTFDLTPDISYSADRANKKAGKPASK